MKEVHRKIAEKGIQLNKIVRGMTYNGQARKLSVCYIFSLTFRVILVPHLFPCYDMIDHIIDYSYLLFFPCYCFLRDLYYVLAYIPTYFIEHLC